MTPHRGLFSDLAAHPHMFPIIYLKHRPPWRSGTQSDANKLIHCTTRDYPSLMKSCQYLCGKKERAGEHVERSRFQTLEHLKSSIHLQHLEAGWKTLSTSAFSLSTLIKYLPVGNNWTSDTWQCHQAPIATVSRRRKLESNTTWYGGPGHRGINALPGLSLRPQRGVKREAIGITMPTATYPKNSGSSAIQAGDAAHVGFLPRPHFSIAHRSTPCVKFSSQTICGGHADASKSHTTVRNILQQERAGIVPNCTLIQKPRNVIEAFGHPRRAAHSGRVRIIRRRNAVLLCGASSASCHPALSTKSSVINVMCATSKCQRILIQQPHIPQPIPFQCGPDQAKKPVPGTVCRKRPPASAIRISSIIADHTSNSNK